jgi:hypothetical protein
MASSNPAFSQSPAFTQSATKAIQWSQEPSAQQLDELYARSSATPDQMDRMSYENTIVKTVLAFVVLLATAAVGWFIPALMIPAAIVGVVLALVKIFKKKHDVDIKSDVRALQKLKSEVEKAKRDLSSVLQVKVTIEGLINGIDFEETITRARFEELCADLFKKTLTPV